MSYRTRFSLSLRTLGLLCPLGQGLISPRGQGLLCSIGQGLLSPRGQGLLCPIEQGLLRLLVLKGMVELAHLMWGGGPAFIFGSNLPIFWVHA